MLAFKNFNLCCFLKRTSDKWLRLIRNLCLLHLWALFVLQNGFIYNNFGMIEMRLVLGYLLLLLLLPLVFLSFESSFALILVLV